MPTFPKQESPSLAEKITGHNHYKRKNYSLECPFKDCQYKFANDYLLRKHLEGSIHTEDIELFKANNPSTAA